MHYSRLRSAVLLALAVPSVLVRAGHARAARGDRRHGTETQRIAAGHPVLRGGRDGGNAAAVRRHEHRRTRAQRLGPRHHRPRPGQSRSRSAASAPARSSATSPASRSRSASTSTNRRSRSPCSRPTSTSTTSSASRCCAARRARCSVPARRRGRCTSRGSRTSQFGASTELRPPPCRTASSAAE